MEGSSDSQSPDFFPLERFPLELRRKIYTFAATREPPNALRIYYHGGAPGDTSLIGRTRLYAVDDFRALETNHEFRREMIGPLHTKNVFDLSLRREEVDEGTKLLQIDISQVRKCRLLIHNMKSVFDTPRMDVWGGSFPLYWHHHLRAFVATLVFGGHQIDSMLVECERQTPRWLRECLRPMAMLRHVGLIHFRSSSPELHPYLRFLESLIMSRRSVPFRNPQEFRDQTQPWCTPGYWREAARGPPPRSTDMTGVVIDKTDEEMEATAEALYEILELEAEMKPQKDL